MARRARAIIRYDGPALANHEMDVHDLAPALLALGDMCRFANEVFNGDGAEVRILVKADVEQKCFQLEIHLVQTLYEHLTALLDSDAIQDAKNILEWLGIISGGAAVVGGGLFGLYKLITKGQPDAGPKFEVHTKGGEIIYQIVGDGTVINVPPRLHELAKDPRMFPAAKKVVGPLIKEGYDRLEFEYDAKIVTYFDRSDAQAIIATPNEMAVAREGNELVSKIKTSVKVRKAVYEGDSKWGIMYKRAIDASMGDADWLTLFQQARVHVPPGSSLVVDLEERVQIDDSGEQVGTPTYTILKVHGVVPPPHQMALFKRE